MLGKSACQGIGTGEMVVGLVYDSSLSSVPAPVFISKANKTR
jgi:hypothetical protein